MIRELLTTTKNLFGGTLDVHPIKLTLVQSVLVVVLALIFSVGLFQTVGIHFPGVWYQVFASLLIASVLAPIFLYPTFKTSERLRQANAIIEKQANRDHLTGLPNMFALSKQLEIEFSTLQSDTGIALHFIDLDRFKQVNDSLGHDAGNMLLVHVADKLQRWVGTNGYVARFGGDEFVIIQFNVTSPQQAESFAADLLSAVSRNYQLYDQDIWVSASAGTALAPQHGKESEQTMKAADMALVKAKSDGVSHYMFNPDLAERAQSRRRVESVLSNAMKNGYVKPYFHSIVRLSNPLDIVGFEALARIELPDGTMLRPDEFIPVAESTGMIVEMGALILHQACKECSSWNPNIYVAVNVSPIQLIRSDFLKTVKDALSASGLAANRLELEITESVLIDEIGHIRPVLAQLRSLGIRIALDDFGSGFCGLHYLRQIVIDKIKIDKSIIDDVGKVQIATNILMSVAGIAREMGLTLTAEGVDTIGKAEFLAAENCAQELQGYLFSRPVPADQARQMQDFTGKNCVETASDLQTDIAPRKLAG